MISNTRFSYRGQKGVGIICTGSLEPLLLDRKVCKAGKVIFINISTSISVCPCVHVCVHHKSTLPNQKMLQTKLITYNSVIKIIHPGLPSGTAGVVSVRKQLKLSKTFTNKSYPICFSDKEIHSGSPPGSPGYPWSC